MTDKIDLGNKYIHAEPTNDDYSNPAWNIVNTSGDYKLGIIQWYRAWRQYVFVPMPETEYNMGCLESITKFMRGLK